MPVMQAIIQSYGIRAERLASSLSVELFVGVIRPAIMPFGLLLLITHAAPIGSAPKKVLYIFEGCFCRLEQLRSSCKMQMNGTDQKLSLDNRVPASLTHRTDPGVSGLFRIMHQAYPFLLLLFLGPWFAFGLISERKPRCHSSYLCM